MKRAEFGFPGPLRDKLVAAILRGEKTATAGLLVEYDDLPAVGERQLLLNSDGGGVAIIEITEVRVLALSEVDFEHAEREGEGFASLEQWRAEHEKFWHSPEFREQVGNPEFTVTDQTQLVIERFRVLLERVG